MVVSRAPPHRAQAPPRLERPETPRQGTGAGRRRRLGRRGRPPLRRRLAPLPEPPQARPPRRPRRRGLRPGRSGADQRADLRGRADSRRRRRLRGDRRRCHRAHRGRVRAAAVRRSIRSSRLRPGGPNGRTEGNVFVGNALETLKWTADDLAQVDAGKFPVERRRVRDAACSATSRRASRKPTSSSSATISSRPRLTSRSNRARRWPTGRTASSICTARRRASRARSPRSPAGSASSPKSSSLISEYTGGGFGSKIPGAHSMAIPALMSKKLNGRPVMMRISREEETYIGRTRPGYTGWIKMGFRKDGRMTACDAFVVEAAGPYRRQGDHATSANNASLMYQVPNMRFRGISVATNTPPGTSQRAPGGLQGSVMFEPMIDEAARKLGIDRDRDPQDQRARRAGAVRPRAGERAAGTAAQQAHQLLRQGAPRQGRRDVQLGGAQEAQRPAPRQQGHAAWPWRSAPTPPDRSASTGSSSSSPTASSTSTRASATSARTRCSTPRASSPSRSTCRGRSARSSGATRARAWRGARCRPAARRPTRTPAPTTPRARRSSATCRSWRRRRWAARPTTTTSATSACSARATRAARFRSRRRRKRPSSAVASSTATSCRRKSTP